MTLIADNSSVWSAPELLSLPSEQLPLSLLSRSLSNRLPKNPCSCALTKTRWA